MNQVAIRKSFGHDWRGMISLELEGRPAKQQAALWSLFGYQNMRTAIADAVNYFNEQSPLASEFVFVVKLPKGIDNGHEVDHVMLFEAEWMVNGFVLVCSS
jgi:hypothetical protein